MSSPTGRRTLLRRSDAAALLASVAGLTLWLSLTDGIFRYLRPSMRPWLVAAGVFIAGLALATAVAAWRERGQGGHRAPLRASLVGWCLILPVVIAISTQPRALGAYAVRQQAGIIQIIPSDFELDSYLASHTTGGQSPQLQLKQFIAAADGSRDDRHLLAATPVRLTGFVVNDDEDPAGGFTLARLLVGCCAGDASAILVAVRGYEGPALPDDQWVEVTGNFDERLTAEEGQIQYSGTVPVLAMTRLRHIDPPREPYEYPG
jgi:uncharacterized repeat protein (TIGR03943 family)